MSGLSKLARTGFLNKLVMGGKEAPSALSGAASGNRVGSLVGSLGGVLLASKVAKNIDIDLASRLNGLSAAGRAQMIKKFRLLKEEAAHKASGNLGAAYKARRAATTAGHMAREAKLMGHSLGRRASTQKRINMRHGVAGGGLLGGLAGAGVGSGVGAIRRAKYMSTAAKRKKLLAGGVGAGGLTVAAAGTGLATRK